MVVVPPPPPPLEEVSTTLLLESKAKYEEVVAVPCDKEAKFIVDAVTAPRTNNLEPLNLRFGSPTKLLESAPIDTR